MSVVISRCEAAPPATAGVLTLSIACRGGATVANRVFARAPLRLMFPRVGADEPLCGVVINTGGGILGGDRQTVDVSLEAGAALLLTGQAAEKVYRSAGADAVVRAEYRIAEGAVLELLPQGTILFDGARLDRHTKIDRQPGGSVLAGEILILGRGGMGEVLRRGRILDRWTLCEAGRPAWIDGLCLDGDIAGLVAAPAGFAGATALATVVHAADDAPAHLGLARRLLGGETRAAASVVGGVLVVRWLGRAAAVRAALGDFWRGFRAQVLARPAALPAPWTQ